MAVSGRKQPLTRSILQDSDEDMPVCSPCENGGSLIEAHGFCSNCKEHLCEACYKSHLRLKLFRNHVLLDKSLMPREVPPPDDMCTKHPAQQLEYYCRNHDKLECSKCVNIHHRTCEDVSYIQDICDDIEETKEFKTLYRTLTGIEHDVVQNEAKVTTNLTDIQTNVNEMKTGIRSFRRYLDQQLDKMEDALCKEADDVGAIDKVRIENVSDECKTLTSRVRAVINSLDVARKTQQNIRMFITLKSTQRILSGWQSQLDDIESKNKIQQYKFDPEKQLQRMICEGHKLGCIVRKDPSDPGVAGKIKTKVEDQTDGRISNVTRPHPFPLKGTGTSSKRRLNTPQDITADNEDTISVEAQSGSESCSISGHVQIDDNTLAVADWINASVKIVKLNRRKVNTHLSLYENPCDIARINKHTLAVTCSLGGYIQLVRMSKSGSLTLGQQIQVGRGCRGISYIDTGGGRLVVSFIDTHKVKVMDMSGTVLKDLSLDSAGRSRFGTPAHITISNDGSTLIVSNEGTNTVTGLTLDGTVKFTYSDDKLRIPAGVAAGDRGEIYVCGWASHSVHVLSSEGRKIKELLKKEDGIKYPDNISFSDNKLFVGGNKNHVDVYRIRYQ